MVDFAAAKLARHLYNECPTVKPTWEQLGEVTKSVWYGKAVRKLAGDPYWWSIFEKPLAPPAPWGAQQLECVAMSDLNLKKLAEQFEELSALVSAISGTFRDAAGGGKPASDERAPAKRPAAGKGKAAAVEADDEVTIDTVREKLKELAGAKGKDKMAEALQEVGAEKLGDVDESQYGELMEVAQRMIDEEDESAPKPAAKKAPAKKAAAKKPAVTIEELTEAAKALIEADKPAFVKLSKKFGKPSECDEEQYGAFLEAIKEAMPAEETDDDLL